MLKRLNGYKNSAFYITSRPMRRYFSGQDVSEGIVVVVDKIYYFTDARYFYGVKDGLSKTVTPLLYKDENTLRDFLKEKGVKKLYVDFDVATVSEYNRLQAWGFEMENSAPILKDLRELKTDAELKDIATACDIAQRAYYKALESVKVGITELGLKSVIENLMVEFGASGTSFDTIVAFGKNSAVPHHESGETKLTANDVILVDMGCKVNGYCSDLTRTAYFGTPTEEFKKVYQSVLCANERAEEGIYSGISVKDADAIARCYLESVNLGEYFTHSLGHGVGLEIHESPSLSPKGQGKLRENTVFTVEPGVYLDGKFGVRIEDTCVIKNGKVKRLFNDNKELIILTIN